MLEDADVLNDPTCIYNCDETGLVLDFDAQNVVAAKGSKSVYSVTSGSKTRITIMGCGNAAGQMVSPMIVHTGTRRNKALEESAPEDWHVIFTENGWMTADGFTYWLKEVCKEMILDYSFLLRLRECPRVSLGTC